MNYGIVSNSNRDTGYEVAIKAAGIIMNAGGTVVMEKALEDTLSSKLPGVLFEDFANIDIKTIISIGGDGTFLSVVAKYRELDAEFIGINKGSIGFLTEINIEDLAQDLTRLVAGDYHTISRTQLLVEVFDKDGNLKGEDVCLNDIMIVRGVKPHVTKLELYIDNQKVEK
nr:NAD(+)/NADH kinase [Saccharofermentans sp.]